MKNLRKILAVVVAMGIVVSLFVGIGAVVGATSQNTNAAGEVTFADLEFGEYRLRKDPPYI